jgi:hypothetical protein
MESWACAVDVLSIACGLTKKATRWELRILCKSAIAPNEWLAELIGVGAEPVKAVGLI